MTVKVTDLKDRIIALADTLLDDNETIPGPYRPIVKNLMRNYLKKADPEQVEELLIRVRDQVIPFVLTGEIPIDKHTNPE
jgi:hypothetical protein